MAQKEFKSFWRETFKSGSPVPIVIVGQVALFVIIHLFDLLAELKVIHYPLYDKTLQYLSLPVSFEHFLKQPWSVFSYSLVYTGLFRILFDSLWLYWMGNLFLNFLNRRQLWYIYLSSLCLGGVFYLALGQIPYLANSPQTLLNTASLPIAGVITATASLVPYTEMRLLFLGNIKLKTVAYIYLGLEVIFYALINKTAAAAYLCIILWSFMFIRSLQNGKDWSKVFAAKRKRISRLQVVHQKVEYAKYSHSTINDLPNQEEIDQILDKISLSGYESLTSREKEVLFKASKQD
ncbi:rhomboid family intramembrane serine protease [Sphingobacterium spiritivorum]|uniref:rhomboid family intramembrane serine protease n=1 Tax=Sphingobacterium spiritivorum TaxID=258 RepID=UPI003DA31DB9